MTISTNPRKKGYLAQHTFDSRASSCKRASSCGARLLSAALLKVQLLVVSYGTSTSWQKVKVLTSLGKMHQRDWTPKWRVFPMSVWFGSGRSNESHVAWRNFLPNAPAVLWEGDGSHGSGSPPGHVGNQLGPVGRHHLHGEEYNITINLFECFFVESSHVTF